MSDDVDVKFGATINELVEKVNEAKEHVAGFAESISGIAASLSTLFVGREIFEFTSAMAELGEQTMRTSEIFGITTEAAGLLKFEAVATGGSADGLIRSLEKMSVSLQQAADKTTPTGLAIHALGLNAKDLIGVPLPELLDKLRERFSELPPGLERTAIAQALVKGGAENLLPILNLSSDKWEELKGQFEATGAAMSGPMAEGFAESQRKIVTFQTALTGFGERIFAVVKPAFDAAIDGITRFVESIDAAHISSALEALVDTLMTVMTKIVEIALGADRIMEDIVIHAQAIADYGIKAFDQAHVTEMGDKIAAMNARVDSQLAASKVMFASWADTIKGFIRGVEAGAANHSGGPDDRGTKPESGHAPKLDFNAPNPNDAASAARASTDGEIAVLQAATARKKAILDEELKNHQISEQRWVTDSQAAVEQAYQAEAALLQKELGLGNLKVTQKAEILNKIKLLEEKHADEVLKIEQKASADAVKAWQGPLDTIGQAFSSQVSSLLKGTETIGDAIQNIALDLATKVVEGAIKSITASAAQAFAGIFGFLAPTMGPAAAGPAIAGQATVMAAGAALSSLDVGTWGLPSDGPIMAHAGETVIPPFESGQFRAAMAAMAAGASGGGSQGGDVHFHVQAIDAAGVAAFLKTHGEKIAKTVGGHFTAQTSLRPSY